MEFHFICPTLILHFFSVGYIHPVAVFHNVKLSYEFDQTFSKFLLSAQLT